MSFMIPKPGKESTAPRPRRRWLKWDSSSTGWRRPASLVIGLLSAFVVYGRWWLVRSPRSDDMRFMIIRKADKNTEAGVLPSQDPLTE